MNNKVSQNGAVPIKNALWLPTCHSTNTYSIDFLKENEVDGSWLIYTFDQTAGRGQLGSRWESEPNKNLTFSYSYRTSFLEPQKQFVLNMAVSVALLKYLDGIGVEARIKWPNDIYVGGHKIAGILIENILRGNSFRYSVIGIGFNVNQATFHTMNATSLYLVLGRELSLERCLTEIVDFIEKQMDQLKDGKENEIREEYLHYLYLKGQNAYFRSSNVVFEGKISGVDAIGRLLVSTPEGERSFGLKEIEFVRSQD